MPDVGVASDGEPEQTSGQAERDGSFALPSEFLTLPPKERREIVWSLALTRSRRRDSLAETVRHSNEDGEPAVIPALTVALEVDPDKLVKRHAAYGLACIPDQAVVPALRGALPAADRATKGHAILALGRLRVRDAVPNLVRLLDDPYARMLVADALVEIGDERALAPLRKAAGRGSPVRRRRLSKRVSALETALGRGV
jgi:HEAT repeat protein